MAAADMLNLLYLSFRALEKGRIPSELIRCIVELRMMVLDGEYTELPPIQTGDSACYAWQYVVRSPLKELFKFTLNPPALDELKKAVSVLYRRVIDREFHSLQILHSMIQPMQ